MNPKNSKNFFTNSLRAVVLGTALVGAAATVGCSGDAVSVVDQTVETDVAGIQQVRKDVHFSLGALPAGSRYELDLGAKTYELTAHDAASASRAGALLESATAPTHFVPEASFSREAPQSFRVFRVDAKGNRFMVAAGIHVPGENGQDKGDKTPIEVNLEDAAEYIVFHDPALLTIDSAAAAKVKAHIRKAPAFARLVAAVKAYGGATTMDQQDQGYQGWAVMLPSLDSKGNQVFIPGGKGMVPATHWAIAGSPEFYKAGFDDIIDSHTKNRIETPYEAAALARKQARIAVRDDVSLRNVMYTQNTDTTVRPTKHMLGASADDLQWTLDDTQWKGDRRISIVKTEGQKVTFKVENNQWRKFGVLVRFRDANGQLIAKSAMKEKPESEPSCAWFNQREDMKYSTLLEIVEGRFTVLGVPLSDETVKQFTVTMPEEAASMEVNIASAGGRRVETPSYVGTELEPSMTVPGSIHTYLLDVAMPLMALTMGAGSSALSALHGHELMVDLATIGVEIGAKIIMAAIASGTSGATAFSSEFASEILAEVIAKHPKLATDLIAWAAEVGAEKALEGAMGAIGAVIEAIEVIGTVAGIAETLGTLANNAPIVYDRISTSETLKLRITPKADETTHAPGMFGPQAKVAKAAIYYGSSTVPTIVSAPIDWSANNGNGPTEILFDVPQQPIGGEVRVKVSLDNGNGWTAAEGEIEHDNHPPHGSSVLALDLEVENNPTPINSATRYVHDRVLTMNGEGKRQFVSTSQAPTVTAPQVCNTADTSKPYICGQSSLTLNSAGILGYSWTGSGQGLKTCDGASMVRASTAQTLNLNPAFGGPDALRQSLDCARTAPVFLAFDPTGKPSSGRHVMVLPVKGTYQVYGIDISKSGSLEPANENLVLGTFRSKNLDVIVSNPATGMLLGLDKAEGAVEVLKLADKPVPVEQAPQGLAVGGAGKSLGRLHDATNLAFLPMGAGFVVLEGGSDGTPGRIQAFTFDGASALLFGSDAAFPLKDEAGKKVTYTDMKIDPTESFVYVTSYVGDAPKPGDYRLDIYRIGDGGFVSRTEGVVAAKIAIDKWRDLYTLNYANLEGSANPEPSVSEWLAPVVDPK